MIREEIKLILQIGLPTIVSNLSQSFVYIIGIHYLGMLGPNALAGASLGVMYCNATGFVAVYGLVGALDTLLFQAIGADPKSPLISVYMQRSFLVVSVCLVPVAVMWVFAEPILLAAGQSQDAVRNAATFIKWNFATLVSAMFYEIMLKYLQCVGAVTFMSLMGVAVAASTPLLFWLLIHTAGLGIMGGPLTLGIETLLLCFICGGVIYGKQLHVGIMDNGCSAAAFKDWKGYLALGLPCYVLLLAEWGSFEVNAAAAGLLGVESLATMAIAMQIMGIAFMVPLGLSSGITVRIGAHLGQNDGSGARTVCVAAVGLVLFVAATNAVIVITLRREIALFFTDETSIIDRCDTLFVYLGAFTALDAVKSLFDGVLNALGYQRYGMIINLLSYGVGIPLGWVLTFRIGMEERGLLVGPMLGSACGSVAYAVFLVWVDWDKAAAEAVERIKVGHALIQDCT